MNQHLTPRTIISSLQKSLALFLELPPDTNRDKLQKQLSQAKTRMGVEGKLSFEWSNDGVNIVLMPAKNAVVVGAIRETL